MSMTSGTLGIVKICFCGFLLYIFLGTQSLIGLPTVVTDLLMVAVILATSLLSGWRLKIKMDTPVQFGVIHFIAPVIVIFVYSTLNQLMRSLGADYLTHGVTLAVRFTVYYVIGIVIVAIFGKKTVDYMLAMGIVAYIPAFIEHFKQYGLVSGFTIMLNPEIFHIQTPLEIHTMTYIFGFITLYYGYNWFVERESKAKWLFFISVMLTLIGTKRIILASVFASLVMMYVLSRIHPRQRYCLMMLGCFILICTSVLYIYVIHSGVLEELFTTLGINANFRFNFWNYFHNRYSMSPLFSGYGLSFGARVMQHEWQNIPGLGKLTNMHNDLLRIYLGLGFVGSLLYWYNYFYGTMRRAARIAGSKAATFVFTMATYFFINAMVCNEGINPITNGMYFMIIYTVVRFGAESKSRVAKAVFAAGGGEELE